MKQRTSDQDADFFPKGAIAFFAALVVFFGTVWVGFYALLLYRR
jgi:hypothetical protein